MRRLAVAASVALAMFFAGSAQAAEIKALITTAMNEAIVVLVPQFELSRGPRDTSTDASI